MPKIFAFSGFTLNRSAFTSLQPAKIYCKIHQTKAYRANLPDRFKFRNAKMNHNLGSAAEPDFLIPRPLAQILRVFGELRFHSDGELIALAFTPEGIICSVEDPGVLRHWNIETGQPIVSHFISDLETQWSFSADARVLASASDDLTLWDVAKGKMLMAISQPDWVTAAAVPVQFGVVATGHDDGIVRIWESGSGLLIRELKGHKRAVGALAFSIDGKRLASAGEDQLICIWDTDTWNRLGICKGHTDRIQAIAWQPHGHLLASAAWDRTARIWNASTFEPVILLNNHDDQVTTLTFSPDGQLLASADSANTIHIWDALSSKHLHILNVYQDEIKCLAFSPDNKLLASAGAGKIIHLWDVEKGSLLSGRSPQTVQSTSLAISPDGQRLASTCGGRSLRMWNTKSGEKAAEFAEDTQTRALAGSPDGRWIATAGPQNETFLYDARTGKLNGILKDQSGPVGALAFARDGTTLATANAADGTVWLWNVLTKEPISVIPVAADACMVESIAFHPDGHALAIGGIDWMATGGSEGAVCIWDIDRLGLVATFNRGTTCLSFHPSGQWLAASSLEDSICVWELKSQELLAELPSHAGAVNAVCYSPDGRFLASGGEDRTIRLWHASTSELVSIHDLDSPIKALCFSPDSRYLYTGNGNTTSYQLEVQKLLHESLAANR